MVYGSVSIMNTNVKRLNLKLQPDIDAKLREIAQLTKLKLVTIISNGIEAEYEKVKGK
jgi:hypothetical protein